MNKYILIFLLLCFLFFESCSKKETVIDEVYIIKSKVKTLAKKHYNSKNGKELPPPPPYPGFYGLTNIIIDKQGEFYFYQRKYDFTWNCIPEENPNPDFINLKPVDLIKVPKNSIVDFLKENTSPAIKKNYGPFIIASQLDTLKTKEFINLMRYVNNTKKSQIRIYLIRRTTQEENVVLQFKKSDSVYDPDEIKWDKDSITFFEEVNFKKK
ncbi:hypothetical protein [Flavobacterium tegetincola]|uniref:hypothetical protein n=1 Tax=Flavobacterium tegetincola TaxID=150172 RepID=UPI0004280325|nr:hypothetical protein [Flavobacterium tegetincola]